MMEKAVTKRWALVLALTLAMSAAEGLMGASTARADSGLLTVWAAPKLGGALGGNNDLDFYRWAGGGTAGIEAGVRILFIGAYFEYLRFFGGDVGANLMSINLGGDNEFRFTKNWSLVLRLASSFYFGSLDQGEKLVGGQVLSSEAVNTTGIGFRGGVGPRYTFLRIFSVGITPQIGYHYFFAGGDDALAAPRGNNVGGWDFQAMAYFRVGLGI